MRRIAFTTVTVVLGAWTANMVAGSNAEAAVGQTRQPNVIIILADDK